MTDLKIVSISDKPKQSSEEEIKKCLENISEYVDKLDNILILGWMKPDPEGETTLMHCSNFKSGPDIAWIILKYLVNLI